MILVQKEWEKKLLIQLLYLILNFEGNVDQACDYWGELLAHIPIALDDGMGNYSFNGNA